MHVQNRNCGPPKQSLNDKENSVRHKVNKPLDHSPPNTIQLRELQLPDLLWLFQHPTGVADGAQDGATTRPLMFSPRINMMAQELETTDKISSTPFP